MKELQLDKCPFCSGSASVIKGHGIYGGMADTMNDNLKGDITIGSL